MPQPLNRTQIKCLLVFSVFAVIGFGPVSPGCLIGMYVVVARPPWFLGVVRALYADRVDDPPSAVPTSSRNPQRTRKKCFLSLLGLFVLDIAPVPVTPMVAFVILLVRPRWFGEMVETIYAPPGAGG